ncbi:MAG: peptidyl-prolyl cis-trans isomerase [Campylobacterales bacterium]|nr:peptidyl-prolyl cis-trans isomerase [Campylobacterales bacterium]
MKKIFSLLVIGIAVFAQAKMVDGVALIVEGEAVTTAEIRAVEQQLHLSKEKAIDLLITDRLQKAAMKNVVVTDDEVDTKIGEIAAQNAISVEQMQQILEARGTPWTKYRSSIQEAMKKEKFFKETIIKSIPEPSDDELKIFYKNHKNEFMLPSQINVVEYSTASKEAMQRFLQTGDTQGIKSRSLTQKSNELNPMLLGMLSQTPNGALTRPFNAGDKYIVFKVLSKSGQSGMSFESARNAVIGKWREQQQNKAIKDYFEKMKTNADVQIIRQ